MARLEGGSDGVCVCARGGQEAREKGEETVGPAKAGAVALTVDAIMSVDATM